MKIYIVVDEDGPDGVIVKAFTDKKEAEDYSKGLTATEGSGHKVIETDLEVE